MATLLLAFGGIGQPFLMDPEHRSPVAVDQLSVTFAALADPTRRAILARLAQGRRR